MKIIFLEPEDAEVVESLAKTHYPASLAMPGEDIRDSLAAQGDDSFYLGVKKQGKLVGYLMAWLDNTLVEGQREKVLLVDDLVLNEEVRPILFRLLDTMIDEMVSRGYGRLPIEGSVRARVSPLFTGHPEAFERLGYELVSISEYFDDTFEEDMTWVRFEALEEPAPELSVDDSLEVDFEDS